jgi:hypothetical protein
MHPLIYIFAYHVDPTTLADGDYKLISDQTVEVSGDPESAVEGLTEAPNQSSENFDTAAPNPTQEGKPRCITQYFKLLHLCNSILMYYILH